MHLPDQHIHPGDRQRAVRHDICVLRVTATIFVRVPAIGTTKKHGKHLFPIESATYIPPAMDHDRQCEYFPRCVRRLKIVHNYDIKIKRDTYELDIERSIPWTFLCW